MNAPQIQARPIPDLYRRFQPWMIPGLGLDLDASYGVLNSIGPDVPATNGQSVRRWLDKSGNGRHFDQTTATNQPVYTDGGVYFDGVNDILIQSVGLGFFAGISGASVFAVFDGSAPVAVTRQALFCVRTAGAPVRALLRREIGDDANAGGRRLDADAYQEVRVPAGFSNKVVGAAVFDYSNALLSLYANGGLLGTKNPYQTNGLLSAGVPASISVGGNSGDSSDRFMGQIARVLVWPRALTTSELLRVHRYLSATYGIALA